MIYFENNLVMLIILLNLATILGITLAKLIYKSEYNIKLISDLSLFLGCSFILYTILLFVFSATLITYGRPIAGTTILMISLVPFIIGKLSTYQEADFFIDLQLMAFVINVFIVCAT